MRKSPPITQHERRLARRIAARGEEGLAEALLDLKGVTFGGRYRCESLYDIGGEGAVFLVRDQIDPWAPTRVAKLALLPFNRPFELDQKTVNGRRAVIALEASFLAHTGAGCMPAHLGTYEFVNPLLDPRRGGAFKEPGPVIVMEKLPGRDLDRWLARVHRSNVPERLLRRTIDSIAFGLLKSLKELLDEKLLYADIRPGNLRLLPQPTRHVRLLDAGSLVPTYDDSGRFPHVPAYLPPELVGRIDRGEAVQPTPEILAVMAGRTLYEVATGKVPHAGEPLDESELQRAHASVHVVHAIRRLASGAWPDITKALDFVTRHEIAIQARQRAAAQETQTHAEKVGLRKRLAAAWERADEFAERVVAWPGRAAFACTQALLGRFPRGVRVAVAQMLSELNRVTAVPEE